MDDIKLASDLFEKSRTTITEHLKIILEEESRRKLVCPKSRRTAPDGKILKSDVSVAKKLFRIRRD
ncbi:hypothetical protein ISU02_09865 [Fusibacter sp. Q10-2]|uniref:Uncharacterized protein n=1 Tax=Fusibacter ferrireducens TaxID=2785058 RepID=A0ABR9ZSI6_9FIRM|nr:hypothetical protein [Fusibacter ferrireducens]